MGSGAIDFADGLTTIGQSDLTGFSFAETTDFQGYDLGTPPTFGTLSFTLPDVTSFLLTLSPGNVPTGFTMTATAGSDSLEDTFTVYGGTAPFLGVLGPAIAGPVTFVMTPAPEPGNAALCGLAASLVGFAGWRKRS